MGRPEMVTEIAAVRIAPIAIHTGREQRSRWRWGPSFDGGGWLIERTIGLAAPWAFRVWSDGASEDAADFDSRPDWIVFELGHPAMMAALQQAEPSTRIASPIRPWTAP